MDNAEFEQVKTRHGAEIEREGEMKDSITLKWGTLKRWDLHTPKCVELLAEYRSLGSCASAMCQHDTREQQEIICQIIDASNVETVYLDWDGIDVTKDEAKAYVMGYGKPVVQPNPPATPDPQAQ